METYVIVGMFSFLCGAFVGGWLAAAWLIAREEIKRTHDAI